MSFIWILIIAAAAAAAAVCIESYRETHNFCVTRFRVSSKKMADLEGEKIKIIFLSDLHNKEYGEKNERLLRAIRQTFPDLILIGGDMLVGKENASYEPALSFVERLTAFCPVIYANGNHEQRMKEEPEKYKASYKEYRRMLRSKGVLFLENGSTEVKVHGERIRISGLELPLETYKKFHKGQVDGSTVEECLGFIPRERADQDYQILLAHNPAHMEAYKEWGADLILSGHLHGGIARIPGIGGVITPQAFLFPKYSGEMSTEGEQTIIVSRGLGSHTINIRLFNMPELILIELKKIL
ncbi:MAG TPA: metallophosphoesterase [Candidatus Mediterraneibacter norfolkensis]|nr:metallophosphoesterase [Candidatus Mediterraneibacter norfolkensis]